MFDDEEHAKKPVAHVLGASLEALSIDELRALSAQLRTESERVDAEIAKKSDVKSAAETVFKL